MKLLFNGSESQDLLSSALEDSPFRLMTEADIPACLDLIQSAMDSTESLYAAATFRHHFDCHRKDIDDGRLLLLFEFGETPRGIVGLHHYVWGPTENVWLSWFAVHPALQHRGIGSQLFDQVVVIAQELGFRKMLIETYSGPTFADARRFYSNRGFHQVGETKDYLPDGSSMLVYARMLQGGGDGKTKRSAGLDFGADRPHCHPGDEASAGGFCQ